MSPLVRKILAQIGSFFLAGALLYLALRGVDLAEVGEALRTADYRWLVPLAGVTLLSHLIRAWRWQMLLEALPSTQPGLPPKRISLKYAFYSIMIGYMVNYAAPRAGEFVRSANMAARGKLRFSSVLGTVVVERILDVLTLLLALASIALLFLDHLGTLNRLFITPLLAQAGRVPLFVVGGVILAVALLVFFIYRRFLMPGPKARNPWQEKVNEALASFKEGMMTLLQTRSPVALLASTVAIWFCYLLMAYLPFVIFGMDATYGLTLLDSWSVMILGAVGVAIPSPGGIGSYHYITIQTLVHLFKVDQAAAASYAILSHTGQLILYVVVGAACLLLQGSSFKTLRRTSRSAEKEAALEATKIAEQKGAKEAKQAVEPEPLPATQP